MKTFSLRTAVLLGIIATLLAFRPGVASAATVTVTIGNGGFFFTPSSVTIHPGDTVHWTWSSSDHSTTSGSPGMPMEFGTLEFLTRAPRSITHSTLPARSTITAPSTGHAAE